MTLREGGVRKHAGAQSWVRDGLTISMRSSDFRLADLVFTCLLVAVLVALIVKNISLGSPIMAGDEYAYFAQAREFPTIDAIVSYDPTIQRTNNTLYLWIGSLLWRYSGQPALIMRVIQSVLYVLVIVVVFALGRCFMERRKSAIVALVTCCTAMSSYSAYFMPETLYQLLFFVLAALLVTISPARSVQGAAACGFVTALLMLTKPHGVAIAAAVTATLLVRLITPRNFGSSRRTAMSALVVFGLTTYLSMVLVNAILVGHFRFSPLLFVGTFYQDVLASTEFVPRWRNLYPVLLGNGIALYILNGIPAILIGCALWLVVTRRTGEMEVPAKVLRTHRFSLLAVFALCALLCSVAMTIRYTADIGGTEIWRIHGRYYSFTIALCIVVMAASGVLLRQLGDIPGWVLLVLRIAAFLGILVLVAVQLWWRRAFSIAPWDFPEIWPFSWSDINGGRGPTGTALVLIGCICFAGMLLRPARSIGFFLVFIALLDAAGLVQVTRWQFAQSRSSEPYSLTASALNVLLAGPSLDRGLIIGPDRGMVTFTLFNLRSRSHVLLLPQQSVVSQGAVGPDVDWVLTEGPYDLRLTGEIVVKTERLTLVALHPMPPFMR